MFPLCVTDPEPWLFSNPRFATLHCNPWGHKKWESTPADQRFSYWPGEQDPSPENVYSFAQRFVQIPSLEESADLS